MSDNDHCQALIISGPCGVGKTSTGSALSALLQDSGVPHTFIDMDALTYTYPRPKHDRFADDLALRNLASVWANARAAGARYLIVPRVVETADYVARIANAIHVDRVHVCRLTASDDVLINRVHARESGDAATWHAARGIELSQILNRLGGEDLLVNTDSQTQAQTAKTLLDWLGWSAP